MNLEFETQKMFFFIRTNKCLVEHSEVIVVVPILNVVFK